MTCCEEASLLFDQKVAGCPYRFLWRQRVTSAPGHKEMNLTNDFSEWEMGVWLDFPTTCSGYIFAFGQ